MKKKAPSAFVRPTTEQYAMIMAEAASTRATCNRAKVGAVIMTERGEIISTGRNGSPPLLPHCSEEGCLMSEDRHCIRCRHAELNAILFAKDKLGLENVGNILACTHLPCPTCAHLIAAHHITTVLYGNHYGHCEIEQLTAATGIQFKKVNLQDLYSDPGFGGPVPRTGLAGSRVIEEAPIRNWGMPGYENADPIFGRTYSRHFGGSVIEVAARLELPDHSRPVHSDPDPEEP